MNEQLIEPILHDRYHIRSLLGRQTGRRTYLASDRQTGSSVVIKLLLFGVDFVWDDLKLFEREAAVLRALDHPAIPQYLDYFDVETKLGKGFALVQTYLEAKSLQEWVQSGRTFAEADLKAIARRLLDVLDYLHHRQPIVVHRDIKPSNILLGNLSGNSLGPIYLVDFGSVQAGRHEGTRTIVGTYGYMPPEQFGGETTPASDLYALGATVIYLATGQHPDRLPQRNLRIQFENNVNLSPHLVDWLQWMTEPSVEHRLKLAQQGLTALATSTPRNQRTERVMVLSQPVGSEVRLTTTPQLFEIVISPRGLDTESVVLILFATVWNFFFAPIYHMAFTNFGSGGWAMLLLLIPFLSVTLCTIAAICFKLFGCVRLQMTQAKISQSSEITGLNYRRQITSDRRHIVKVELTKTVYQKDSEGGAVAIPPQINIWAGTKQFSIGGNNLLTPPELEWLAHEISHWLDIPIS
jgi:serine/threonine protein kinase